MLNGWMQKRLANIQALRGFAALAVVSAHLGNLTHYDPNIPVIVTKAGVFGVDIFFVMSGYIIASVTGGERWGRIYPLAIGRIWRIAPLYWLLTLPELPWRSIVAYARDGALFTNWEYYLKSFLFIPAFSPGSSLLAPALNQGWSLIYEMAFYGTWLAMMLGPRTHLLPKLMVGLTCVFLSGTIAPEGSVWRAFAANPIIYEFALGVMIAEIMALSPAPVLSRLQNSLLIVAAVLLMVVLDSQFAVENRLWIFGLPAAVMVAAAIDLEKSDCRAPRWLCFLGDASYAIYLIEAGMIAAVAALLAHLPGLPASVKLLTIGLAAVAAGCVVHVLYERPLMAWRRRSDGSLGSSAPLARPALADRR